MQLVKYAKILQLNHLQIAPVHCFSYGVNINNYTNLSLFTTTVVVLTLALTILIYWLIYFVNGRYTIYTPRNLSTSLNHSKKNAIEQFSLCYLWCTLQPAP